jgi:diacylglycerol kinase (ATP)
MTRTTVLILANPVAGGFRFHRLEALKDRLDQLGHQAEIQLTRKAGDVMAAARFLDPGIGTLVVAGGDGSINEAVTGLLARAKAMAEDVDSPLPRLAVLPSGTANVLAHELSLPFSPRRLADAIAAGKTTEIHPGLIGEQPFVLMVSAGFDADVVHGVDSATKKRWGKIAYIATALKLAMAGRGRDVTVRIGDSESLTCRLAVVTTAASYGGAMKVTRETHVTRSGLRLITLADDRRWTLVKAALLLAIGRLEWLAAAADRAIESVRLSGPGLCVQIDGDRFSGDALAEIRAAPRCVEVVVP